MAIRVEVKIIVNEAEQGLAYEATHLPEEEAIDLAKRFLKKVASVDFEYEDEKLSK